MHILDEHGFDLWAGGYDQSVSTADDKDLYPFAGYQKLMTAVYSSVMEKGSATVFDIGIGTGTLSTKLYESGNTITGLDFSAEMLNIARDRMPNARLIQYDFSKGLPDELINTRFDFIISTYAIHHLEDTMKVALIRELLVLIEKTGVIYIGDVAFQTRADLEKCQASCGSAWDQDEYYFVFQEIYDQLKDECHLTYHQVSHCAGLLEIRNF